MKNSGFVGLVRYLSRESRFCCASCSVVLVKMSGACIPKYGRNCGKKHPNDTFPDR